MEEDKWRAQKQKEVLDKYQEMKANELFDLEVLIYPLREDSQEIQSKGN